MTEFTPKRLLCLHCGTETVTTPEMKACPGCGDREHVPANLDDTVTITITNHELRLLTIWADHYARKIEETSPGSRRALQTVLNRLAIQTSAPLSIAQEVADLMQHYGDVKVLDESGREIDLFEDPS